MKSFIASGIFPLNRHAIDTSRVLQTNTSVTTLSSPVGTDGNVTTTPPLLTNAQTVILPTVPTDALNSIQYDPSSFVTSQNAIFTLSEVLDITTLDRTDMNVHANDVDDDRDGDDGEGDDDHSDNLEGDGDKEGQDEDDDENDSEDNDSDESYVPYRSSSKGCAKRKRASSKTTRADSSDEGNCEGSNTNTKIGFVSR